MLIENEYIRELLKEIDTFERDVFLQGFNTVSALLKRIKQFFSDVDNIEEIIEKIKKLDSSIQLEIFGKNINNKVYREMSLFISRHSLKINTYQLVERLTKIIALNKIFNDIKDLDFPLLILSDGNKIDPTILVPKIIINMKQNNDLFLDIPIKLFELRNTNYTNLSNKEKIEVICNPYYILSEGKRFRINMMSIVSFITFVEAVYNDLKDKNRI